MDFTRGCKRSTNEIVCQTLRLIVSTKLVCESSGRFSFKTGVVINKNTRTRSMKWRNRESDGQSFYRNFTDGGFPITLLIHSVLQFTSRVVDRIYDGYLRPISITNVSMNLSIYLYLSRQRDIFDMEERETVRKDVVPLFFPL